jgi:hypothetical protein
MLYDLPRRLVAELLGSALLVTTIVGSGIMAESLTKDAALALLGNMISDRGDSRGSDRDPRTDIGRALQPGRHAGFCDQARSRSTRCGAVRAERK